MVFIHITINPFNDRLNAPIHYGLKQEFVLLNIHKTSQYMLMHIQLGTENGGS